MMFSLLADGDAAANTSGNSWVSYVLIGVLVVILVVSMIFMNRRQKKRDQEVQKLIDAVKPGNKVKTIGGICGIVTEVNVEEDTFVLETGSEATGKSYMRFVRQAILESDAVVESDKKTEKASKERDEEPAATEEQPANAEEAPAKNADVKSEEKAEDKKEDKE